MTTILDGINHGLRQCLEASNDVYLLGEDLLDPYGGAFKVVRGLSSDFPDRVITTPVSEAGVVGIGVGMALRGLRPVVEIMFGDFLTLAADQLINHAAKFRWMSDDQVRVPLVVRTPMGGYRGYGPTHSQTLEKHFLGVAGLRVVALNPFVSPEALINQVVLEEDDPALLVEHKLLYPLSRFKDNGEFAMEQSGGRYPWAKLRIAGAPRVDITLAAYGYMAEITREAMHFLAFKHEVFSELVVPSQLSPFELDPLFESARQTGKVLTIEEGTMNLGWGAELSARIVETVGSRVHIKRAAAENLPVPAAAALEQSVLPQVGDIVALALSMNNL